MLSADLVTADALTGALAAQLRSRGGTRAIRTALIAEHIRALVSAPYFQAAEQLQPIHTNRMFAALDRNVGLEPLRASAGSVAGRNPHEEYETVRNQLRDTGDIVDVGAGRWIPGPLRILRGTSSAVSVVLGGLPTQILEAQFHSECRCIGAARYLSNMDELEAVQPFETAAEWLGVTEPLASWTQKILEWASTTLQPQANVEDTGLEIYAPDIQRERRRIGFWVSARDFQEAVPTLRLFRPRVAPRWAFDRPYYLGLFALRVEGARLTRAVGVARETALRLRYGFDLKYGTARALTLRRTDCGHLLEVKFALPKPEARVLSLGWHDSMDDSVRYFDKLILPVLEDVLAALGMRLEIR